MPDWKLSQRSPAAAWLRAAAERRALPHALLFTGGDGPAAAEFAAAAMECTAAHGRPCGTCHACRKVLSGVHPDVTPVRDPEHKLLSAEVIRNVRADAYIRPNEGARKVYIFPDCALLTEADQNILLKTVEEAAGRRLPLLRGERRRRPAHPSLPLRRVQAAPGITGRGSPSKPPGGSFLPQPGPRKAGRGSGGLRPFGAGETDG